MMENKICFDKPRGNLIRLELDLLLPTTISSIWKKKKIVAHVCRYGCSIGMNTLF